MNTDRLPCATVGCERKILPVTGDRTGGYCMPCFNELNTMKRCNSCKSETPILTYKANDGLCMTCVVTPPVQYSKFKENDLPITLSDLIKQDVDEKFPNDLVWRHSKCIMSTLARTFIELQVEDGGEPDDLMLTMLNEGVRTYIDSSYSVHDKVYASYECYGECIDGDIDRGRIGDYIDDCVLYVNRCLNDEYTPDQYRARWFCRPEWDTEHCIYYDLADSLEPVDC